MSYASKQDAVAAAADMALRGAYPSRKELEDMKAVGLDYAKLHSLLKEVFYNGKEYTSNA